MLLNEGMLGLAHAFIKAGAQTVVTSLWPIEDKFTQTFMEHFYTSISFLKYDY